MRTSYALASDRLKRLTSEIERLDALKSKAGLTDTWKELDSLSWLRYAPYVDPLDHGAFKGLRDWFNGAALQDIWVRLHRIEEDIDTARSLEDVVRAARAHTLTSQKARKQLDEDLHNAADTNAKKAAAIDAVRSAHERAHQTHIDERQRNRATVAIAVVLALAAGAIIVFQQYRFEDAPLLVLPPDAGSISATSVLALVLGSGALGGLISGLVSVYLTAKTVDDTMWFDPRPALVVVKTALGAWTAVLGVLMVGTGLLVGLYTSVPSALLLAFLFGYGQQAVTGTLLDRHIGKLVDSAD